MRHALAAPPRAARSVALLPLAALALASSLLAVSSVTTASAAAAKPTPSKPTVAVLYFDYDGANTELQVLRKGLAQMLTTDLAALDGLTLVERTRLEDVLAELNLAQRAKLDAATAAKVGKLLGARYLVMGRYFDLAGNLRIDARAVETETGRVLHSLGAHGKPDDFLALEQKLAEGLGETLSKQVVTAPAAPTPSPSPSPAPSPSASPTRTASLTPAPDSSSATPTTPPKRARPPKKLSRRAALGYSRALDALDQRKPEVARTELEAVVQEQPDFDLARAELAGLLR